MLDNLPSTPTTAPQARVKPPATERITSAIRTAIEAMVWLALPRAKAAEVAGITEHGLYKALRKPPVRALYLQELEVLRTSERARNIHALCEVRDQTESQNARVAAVNSLERLSDPAHGGSDGRAHAGFVIQVINVPGGTPSASVTRTIDAKPLVHNENET